MLIETCCGSAHDVIQSCLAGADRAELNSALFLGGLTPSIGALSYALEHTSGISILTMVRPRSGGFCYSEADYQVMLSDARSLCQTGSHGIVFGFLNRDGTIDTERCKAMLEIIGHREAVFHRAFDVVPDWKTAMDQLVELGVRRILTSGQRANAWEGRETLRSMIQYAAGRIEILPGAGIRPYNAKELIAYTGCSQLHMSVRKNMRDESVKGNPEIHFGNPSAPDEFAWEMIDADALRPAIQTLHELTE